MGDARHRAASSIGSHSANQHTQEEAVSHSQNYERHNHREQSHIQHDDSRHADTRAVTSHEAHAFDSNSHLPIAQIHPSLHPNHGHHNGGHLSDEEPRLIRLDPGESQPYDPRGSIDGDNVSGPGHMARQHAIDGGFGVSPIIHREEMHRFDSNNNSAALSESHRTMFEGFREQREDEDHSPSDFDGHNRGGHVQNHEDYDQGHHIENQQHGRNDLVADNFDIDPDDNNSRD